MAYQVPFPTVAGALVVYESTDILIMPSVASDTTITGAFLNVSGAPTTEATIEIRNGLGGGGSLFGEVSIAAGEYSGSASGSLAITAGESVYGWITDGDDALQLSGYVEFSGAPAFCTVAEVRDHGNVQNSDLDLLISTMISGRTRAMQKYMSQFVLNRINTAEKHRYWNGWTGALVLEQAPVQSVSSVTVDGSALVADTDYEVELDSGVIHRMSGINFIPWEAAEILVTYTSGSSVPPDDLRQACIEQVRHDLSQANQGGDRLGEISRSLDTGGTSTYLPAGWLDSTRQAMDRYREINV